MKDSNHKAIVGIIIFLLFVGLVCLGVRSSYIQDEKHDEICIKIAEANDFVFLFQSGGDCGWKLDCYYQCRFINSEGEQVIKNVE